MEQGRTKRVKTSATRVRRREVGSPSTRTAVTPTTHLSCKKPVWQISRSQTHVHKEFYANFRYKDGKYWSMISGNLFELNDDIFMNVGGLSSSGYSIGDCSWVKENFDPTENNVMINWPEEILKIMNSVSLSQSKLLPYSIFISRIVDYLHIDVSDTIIVEYTDKDHLVGESLIHKMGIYKYARYNSGGAFWISTSELCFWLDQLEAMEQRLNNRMDLHFQGLKDSYFAGMEQYEERQTAYSDNQFQELRNLIQSTAEAQNALFCSEFQKLSVLIRGDQNIVIPADHTDDPPPPPQP
ncbi:hypothetical protein Lal_00031582 [Lupinus albus]|nr:hypothetical protein Lal_00031582 [Lupinus albus]